MHSHLPELPCRQAAFGEIRTLLYGTGVDEYIEEAPASGLRQAPTLAVQSGDKTELYTGVAQIKALLKEPAL